MVNFKLQLKIIEKNLIGFRFKLLSSPDSTEDNGCIYTILGYKHNDESKFICNVYYKYIRKYEEKEYSVLSIRREIKSGRIKEIKE